MMGLKIEGRPPIIYEQFSTDDERRASQRLPQTEELPVIPLFAAAASKGTPFPLILMKSVARTRT
jgi:hypothetical protein